MKKKCKIPSKLSSYREPLNKLKLSSICLSLSSSYLNHNRYLLMIVRLLRVYIKNQAGKRAYFSIVTAMSMIENCLENSKKISRTYSLNFQEQKNTVFKKVLRGLLKRVMPLLRHCLTVNDSKKENAKVWTTILKTLRLLPPELLDKELPKILWPLITSFKNSENISIMKNVRRLAELFKDLGSKYVVPVLNMLSVKLPPKQSLTQKFKIVVYRLVNDLNISVAQLRYCDDIIDFVLPVLKTDLLSYNAGARIISSKQVNKSHKDNNNIPFIKPITIFGKLCRFAGLERTLDTTLECVVEYLTKIENNLMRAVLQKLLDCAAKNISENPRHTRIQLIEWLSIRIQTINSYLENINAQTNKINYSGYS